MLDISRSLDDVLETLTRAQKRGERATLVLGAGCSVSAGVPLAGELMTQMEQTYPLATRRATSRTYDAYLRELSPCERRKLTGKYIHRATLNPAHLAVAHLFKGGVVDRVVTLNFDPLLQRACALSGEFPALFCLPYLSSRALEEFPEKALYYVQGQDPLAPRTTPRLLRPILEEARQKRAWIVVGYSGTDTTLFPRLAAHPHYENRLYWVGHGDTPPAEPVQRRLLKPGKEAYWVPGYDADTFLVQLVQHLGGFSSDFADRLLEHPTAVLETLSPVAQPSAFLERLSLTSSPTPKEIHPSLTTTQLHEADYLVERAQFKANDEADALFESAYARYAAALTLQTDPASVYQHWAMALSEQAKLKTGTEAEQLLSLACEKYALASQGLSPDPQREHLWGMALARRAQLTRGEPSAQLLAEAQQHLECAEQSCPGIAAYFLACLRGSQGDLKEVKRWLTRCQKSACLPPRALLESNPALKAACASPWFPTLFS